LLIAVAIAAAVLLVALVVPRLLRRGRPVPAQDRPGTVLLVPGYGGGTGSVDSLADRLRAAGHRATVVPPSGDGTGDLRLQADTLDRYAADALRSGAPSVDVIGYSAGGVVTRLWAQDHDGTHKARRIITLGSPHHGARIAAAGSALPGACPIACQQLVPGSRLLATLTTPVRTPPLWMAVWTVQDQTVTPPDSARIEGAVNVPIQSICPSATLGHGDLPTNPIVTALVLAALGPGPITPPTTCPG
jgi:pimeloyl-ACP methyl ester carboxylesterase